MSIKGIESWQILQQNNGYASCSFTYEVSHWLRNPELDEEKRLALMLKGIRARVIDENTGRVIVPWTDDINIENGKAVCEIKDIPTGGLYMIQVYTVFQEDSGHTFAYPGDTVRHIGVGDLYLIIGQSNAEGNAYGPYEDEPMLGVSELSIYNGWDLAVNYIGEGGGVSPFISFAKKLRKTLNYPIGLIPRAVGGSPISTWVKGGDHMKKLRREVESGLGPIKGILWYQGCTDANDRDATDIYESQFASVHNELNDLFGNVPIITYQLNRIRVKDETREDRFDRIREAQRRIAMQYDDCYIIPTIDLIRMSDVIHNGVSDSIELGYRTARFVLDKIYNKEKHFEAPTLGEVRRINSNEIVVCFDNVADDTLMCMGGGCPIRISDNGVFKEIKEFVLDKNTVRLKFEDELGDSIGVSVNSGLDPTNLIYDHMSKLPAICVYECQKQL